MKKIINLLQSVRKQGNHFLCFRTCTCFRAVLKALVFWCPLKVRKGKSAAGTWSKRLEMLMTDTPKDLWIPV